MWGVAKIGRGSRHGNDVVPMGVLERGAKGAGQSVPFLSVLSTSRAHLGAVAARLARRQVLAELMAQMCGTEPCTGGATRLEFEGRWATVL